MTTAAVTTETKPKKKPATKPKAAEKPEKKAKTGLGATSEPERPAYLVWVGSEHYAGIKDWSDEAVELGISKRLPTIAMAKTLMEPGVTIFVAHDEGEAHDCAKCVGLRECGDCRKRINEAAELRKKIDAQKDLFKGDWKTEAPRSMHRFEETRLKHIARLEAECKGCKECGGKGKIKGGTGGHVKLVDGRKWDYRTYNYWLHQPGKFKAEELVASKEMCETCGGTGELPAGRIFGMFIPERIEYILEGDEDKEAIKALKGMRLVKMTEVAKEAKRKCGKRKPGGVYAVTSSTGDGVSAREAVEKWAPGAKVELNGNFVRFLRDVPIAEKRFRGMKSVDGKTIADAIAQADMAKEALED